MKEKLLTQIIEYLIKEENYNVTIPSSYEELKKMYKALVNMRNPLPISEDILKLEDKYLTLELQDKILTDVNDLEEIEEHIILWQGDITTLKCDVIVNAGNEDGLGCFNPNHLCIDNVIHTNSGMRLRLECYDILKESKIKRGENIICFAYNLPSKKVITTVGPQIIKNILPSDEESLANCYKNALKYAIENNYHSIAFPSISTGIYHYPISLAKLVAYNTVKEVLKEYQTDIKVIFNVFSESDYNEYQELFKN